jgi:hypothetical protein
MRSCTLNDILNSNKYAHIANNPLLKDLTIPTGYFVNDIPTLSVPIIYEHCLECIDNKDEKCIDKCLNLVGFNEYNQSNQSTLVRTKNQKTKNKKPKKTRKTRKSKK